MLIAGHNRQRFNFAQAFLNVLVDFADVGVRFGTQKRGRRSRRRTKRRGRVSVRISGGLIIENGLVERGVLLIKGRLTLYERVYARPYIMNARVEQLGQLFHQVQVLLLELLLGHIYCLTQLTNLDEIGARALLFLSLVQFVLF